MKSVYAFLVLFIFLSCSKSPQKQLLETAPRSLPEYSFETVEGDPLGAMIYTLDNGLKVYMSINRDEPRIQTNIAVKTGSKQDPSDATGLAHYLEHMLFKGTSEIGTMDWEKEKILLAQISDTYEKRRNATSSSERDRLYAEIDSLSVLASEYVVANEYDKMISSLGAKGTNAYTSLERTVYINDIPSNELEKWLKVESERFSELVLRLFHTELETVYEEFNIGQDNDRRKVYQQLMAALFKKHAYGTQTTIGTGEHLKNPSMQKIHDYFDTYYVPNNMAIILSGDLDPQKTVALIEKYFGGFESKPVPEFAYEAEDPISEAETYEVIGRDKESSVIGFRLPGAGSEAVDKARLMTSILSNGQAGLIDSEIIQQQKALSAYAYVNSNKDYSFISIGGSPREGQSLEQLNELLLEQLDRLRKGDFEDWLLDAILKDFKLSEYQRLEYNRVRARIMNSAFIMEQDWSYACKDLERIEKLTKEDIVQFANEYCGPNQYVTVLKRTGEPTTHKVEKPAISQLELNREVQSKFMKDFQAMDSERARPQFLDFEKTIKRSPIKEGLDFYHVSNQKNPTFQMEYIYELGSWNDPKAALALSYAAYLGSSKYTAVQLNEEFYRLGCYYGLSAGNERSYVYFGGLDESMPKAMKLIEHFMKEIKVDEEAYDKMVDDILKQRTDAKLNKDNILYSGLLNYARYGSHNPFTDILSEEELRAIRPQELVDIVKNLMNLTHMVYYYGPRSKEEVEATVKSDHSVPLALKAPSAYKEYPETEQSASRVLFAHYDMVQSEIMMISQGADYDESLLTDSRLFNQYFGSGLSSIVFQEIRESKALAYSAYAAHRIASRPDRTNVITAYVGTQVDKMEESIDAMLLLMNEMPRADDQFEASRLAALKKIETSRTKDQRVFWNYLSAQRFGRDNDINKRIYEELSAKSYADLQQFFDEHVKGKEYTFIVMGHRDKVDMDALKKIGPVTELSLEDLFGY